MSKISVKDVQRVAHLARLRLDEEELQRYTEELNDVFTFLDQLNGLDTSDIPATCHIIEKTNVMREDVVQPSLSQEEALHNAPDKHNGQFKVPAVLSR